MSILRVLLQLAHIDRSSSVAGFAGAHGFRQTGQFLATKIGSLPPSSRGTFHFHSFQGSGSFQKTPRNRVKRIRFLKRTMVEKSGKGINP